MKGIILVISLFLISTSLSFATCGCEEQSLKQAYRKSDLIFKGKLIQKEIFSREIKAPKINVKQKYTTIVYTFEVVEVIKGIKNRKVIKLETKPNSINFDRGKTYLVFAYLSKYLLTSNFYLNGEKVKPFLVTDVCTKTKEFTLVDKKTIRKIKKLAKRDHRLATI